MPPLLILLAQNICQPKSRPRFKLESSEWKVNKMTNLLLTISVTRLGNLLQFGQLFKACGNNYFAQTTHILGNFYKVVGIFHFSSEINFGQLL